MRKRIKEGQHAYYVGYTYLSTWKSLCLVFEIADQPSNAVRQEDYEWWRLELWLFLGKTNDTMFLKTSLTLVQGLS